MKRRIFGIETEYGVLCADPDSETPPITAEEAATRVFHDVVELTRATNTFLPNGARLYLDIGAHPEYATAECDQLLDLLHNDRAGDEILAEMAAHATARLNREGINGHIHLFKNNEDGHHNSYGCHENYLVRRRRDFRARIDSLIPFFVTRQILVGAGRLRPGGAGFEISQRATYMQDAVSAASSRTRPMINTRDEPHADAEHYRRLHVIVGDSNMADSATLLKVGMASALLDAIEVRRPPVLELADPIAAIQAVSRDLTGKARVHMRAGGTRSAWEIQQLIFDFVQEVYAAEGWDRELSDTQKYVFELWQRGLAAIEHDDLTSVATELEWVAKLNLLRRTAERHNLKLADPKIARLDLAWHDITARGLRPRLENSGLLRRLTDPAAVSRARTIPPQTTRAKMRGDFVALAQEQRRDFMADWTGLRLISDPVRNALLLDPFASSDPQVDAILEELEND
ncbi:MAG: Pup--protein ligase [Trueperella sp.]|nr:Pup--protein ligase [Trueperella sp.]